MKVKIVRIDHDGFNGREHPPTKRDLGHTVVVASVVALWGEQLDPIVTEGALLEDFADGDVDADALIYMYTCVTEDKRILELMEFEVEVML